MDLKKISLLAVLFLFAVQGIHAQNKPDSIPTEQRDEKGDLYQLTQRAYLAFNAYVWGSTKLQNGYERPVIAIYKNGEKDCEGISDENLKKISIDDVKSIEVVYGTTETVLFGTKGITCVIKITLK